MYRAVVAHFLYHGTRMQPPGLTWASWQTLCVLALVGILVPTAATQPHQRGRSQVVLAWDYDQPAPPIDGFLVQRRTGTGPWQEVSRVEMTLRTFTDSPAARNTPLCYQVRAYRGQEQSSASNEVCLTIPAATQPPARPRPGGRVPRRRTASCRVPQGEPFCTIYIFALPSGSFG